MMLKQLRRKFTLITMGIVTAMLLIIFGLIFYFTKSSLETQSFNMLQTLAQGDLPSNGTSRPDIRLPYFILQVSFQGDVIVTGSSSFDLNDKAFLEGLIKTVSEAPGTSGYIEEYGLLYRFSTTPGIQRLVFLDISSQNATLRGLVKVSILVGILSLGAFLVVSILLARWAVKPVEKAWKQQRQFVSDASHELKTPLTVIMSNAELLRTAEAEDTDRYSQNILTMSYQMRSLVEGLLELARADNGQIRKAFAAVDMSKLVSDAVLPFEPLCFEQGLELQEAIAPGISLNGNAQYLQQAVDILLDNAQKYTSAGIIHVRLVRQGRSQCLLSVSNPGQPIPPDELEKIFERFYRTDKARSRNGSFGLGLSIARSIVTEHGGKIWAESNPTGNCFYIQLPCNPAQHEVNT